MRNWQHVPLKEIHSYAPSYKVESCLSTSLWKNVYSEMEVFLEVFSLCAQLELSCKDAYASLEGSTDSSRMEYLNSFSPLAMVEFQKMKDQLSLLNPSVQPDIQVYLRSKGFNLIFPRVWRYLTSSENPNFKSQKGVMRQYFERMSSLNQLFVISQQISTDLHEQVNHKYIAHQTALLHSAVGEFGNPMSEYKQEIEKLFTQVKSSIKSQEGQIPHLPATEKNRLDEIAQALMKLTKGLHEQLCRPIETVVTFLQETKY